jgi:hypothetical protein
MRTTLLLVIALATSCSKPSNEQKAGSAAPPGSAGSSGAAGSSGSAGSGASAAAEPAEAATVVGPTKSAKGVLEVSGLMTGKFEWIKKDQTSPISCAWSVEKEIGGLSVDVSDGAGHLIKLTVDVPPTELGMPRLDAVSADLPNPVKTKLGFNMSGDGDGNIEVKIDSTLTADGAEPEAPAKKKGGKKEDKPAVPSLMIKGTLEVTCPKKK